jgi:hypothetical protein
VVYTFPETSKTTVQTMAEDDHADNTIPDYLEEENAWKLSLN